MLICCLFVCLFVCLSFFGGEGGVLLENFMPVSLKHSLKKFLERDVQQINVSLFRKTSRTK